jgi:1-acyl-sn-glycerol-3-phosphate acyltransferase
VILRLTALLLFYLFALAALLFVLPAVWVFGAGGALIRAGQGAMEASRRILGLRVEVRGREHLDPAGPAVFMPNHQSFLDGPLVFLLVPRTLRVIIKQSVFRVPVLGQGMRAAGFVPVDRKGVRTGRAAIDRAARAMKGRGYSFLVFPEGTRTLTGRLREFRRGGFFLAAAAGAPVIPVSIQGTFALMPKGRLVPRRGPVRVTFHPPVSAAGVGPDEVGALIARVRGAILAGLD